MRKTIFQTKNSTCLEEALTGAEEDSEAEEAEEADSAEEEAEEASGAEAETEGTEAETTEENAKTTLNPTILTTKNRIKTPIFQTFFIKKFDQKIQNKF